MRRSPIGALALLSLAAGAMDARAQSNSCYIEAPNDPAAVYLSPEGFAVHADGVRDDTAALQEAIDQVGANHGGVLFVPAGTYLLSDTVYVWPGVRVIGFGAERPVFKLAAHAPGFGGGEDKYLLYFSGGRGRNPGDPVRDANPGTFYSALTNIDIEIGAGNPGAAAVRFHVAQHCYLSHVHLRLGDARAGLVDIGNIVEDLHIEGGQVGIDSIRSSPGWPIAVLDCTFDGQRVAAIQTNEAGLAIVRPTIRNVPAGVVMAPGTADELWISDGRFENIADAAIVVSLPNNACTQVGLENIACENVPVLAAYRGSEDRTLAPGTRYVVDTYTHGLLLGGAGAPRRIGTKIEAHAVDTLPALVVSDIPRLPSTGMWVNVSTLGVIGDGHADDTAALRAAIAAHPALYFPMGWYNVTDTLELRADTALIGLHPGLTVINVPNDAPAFAGDAGPRAVIAAPAGGMNIVTGLGVYAGERNPGAIGVAWRAGAGSMLDDVRFHGGHGTRVPGRQVPRAGERDLWNTQSASLLVTDDGGGVFKNIWTPNPHARSGLHVVDTRTPGHVYAMSVEHHVENEVIVERSAGWRFYALQFEEEREESPRALPLKIEDCRDLLFANTFFYRVVSCFVPSSHAATVAGSEAVRFRNMHVYSNSKVSFDTAMYDAHSGTEVRDPEFAALDLPSASAPTLPTTVPGARVEKLADGFQNIAGAAAAPNGDVYFAEARGHRIYRWSHEHRRVEPVREISERPEQLAFDREGNLLVIAYEGDGTVLAFDPTREDSLIQRLEARPAEARPGGTPILPVSRWSSDAAFLPGVTAKVSAQYVAPDGATFIPADEGFTTGATSWGTKLTALLRSFGVAPADPGRPFYVTNELGLRTYAFDVRPDGSLTDPRLFAEEGGECVTTDGDGNVYIAAGQVLVFNPAGERVGVIHVPRRPTCLVFGGADGRTLYVTARDALYAVTLGE